MALTPDDVVTKQFQHVRFKEGFDPEEVDDFLDEIVVEWRKTIAENEELKAKLAAYESGAMTPAAPEASEAPEAAREEAPEHDAAPEVEAETEVEVEAADVPAAAGAAPAATSAGIIELAQRLHDEHVADGVAQRDQLIAEAQATASRIVSEAEAKQREVAARQEKEQKQLEARIADLRQFERDYRSQLRSYIEGQLRDLETSGTQSSGTAPVSSIGQ